jgi:hypothetical protein
METKPGCLNLQMIFSINIPLSVFVPSFHGQWTIVFRKKESKNHLHSKQELFEDGKSIPVEHVVMYPSW